MKEGPQRLVSAMTARNKRHLVSVPNGVSATRQGGTSPESLRDTRSFRRYRVSAVGQLTLPASARQRWGIAHGGPVEVADLGFGVLILPATGAATVLKQWLSAETEQEVDEELYGLFSSRPRRSKLHQKR